VDVVGGVAERVPLLREVKDDRDPELGAKAGGITGRLPEELGSIVLGDRRRLLDLELGDDAVVDEGRAAGGSER
jgi:hypothetical protein